MMEAFLQRVQNQNWYMILILVLSLLSGVLLVFELVYPDAPQRWIDLSQEVDLWIAYVFAADFLVGWYVERRKGLKFWKENWLNFLSSIPVTNSVVRFMRFLRIIRALRAIRPTGAYLNIYYAVKKKYFDSPHA